MLLETPPVSIKGTKRGIPVACLWLAEKQVNLVQTKQASIRSEYPRITSIRGVNIMWDDLSRLLCDKGLQHIEITKAPGTNLSST